jgi:vacuolar-type H+-ATPase subunit H
MPDYSKAKIYRIVSNVCDLVYYGSTCETLSRRLCQHRGDYKLYLKENQNYITSFQIIEKGNYEIVLVENYPCNSKAELKKRERFYIENNDCVNKYIPGRTKEEYYQDNREKILEYLKEYREKNREKILEYFKEYCEENREKILEQKKEYREENREKISQQRKEKICCEICGSTITKHHYARHQRTLKCQKASII